MVTVENLSFGYSKIYPDVIKNISFSINKGEIFGFLGPSGAGKSTAQKIITGQLKSYSGSVKIDDNEISTSERSIYNRVGVAFEFPNLYDRLTATENLQLFGAFYTKTPTTPDVLLKMVNLWDDRNTLVGSYSKGMKMRLNFARSIMHKPDLLFLDEPTSGLDPVNARLVKEIILDMKKQGTTVFLTTHNMNDADQLCDKLALIDHGKIVIAGSPFDLKQLYGEKKVKVTHKHNGLHTENEFELKGIAADKSFLELLNSGDIETLHTCEATLEDIFIKVTGHNLTGLPTE